MLIQKLGVQCKCGGFMVGLKGKSPFTLTEDHHFIIEGVCDKCKQGVNISWSIHYLLMICPIPDKKSH